MQLLRTLVLLGFCCAVPAWAGEACSIPRVKHVRAVPAAAAGEMAVATQNMARLFDDRDDGNGMQTAPADYRRQLQRWARHVTEVLQAPAVLAVQEVENRRVLDDLALAVRHEAPHLDYRAFLLSGNDRSGINVGFLVRADVSVTEVESLMGRERLALDRSLLFDRPPLRLRLQWPGGMLDVVTVHMRSLKDSDHAQKALRVAVKRATQAEYLAAWVAGRSAAQPPLLVLGDFNATEDGAGGVDALAPLQAKGLRHLNALLPADDRHTYVYRCRAEALDHAFASPELAVVRVAVSRGNAWADGRARKKADGLVGLSDHDALVVYVGQNTSTSGADLN